MEIKEQTAKEILEKGYSEAEKTLQDENKLGRLLTKIENKVKTIPGLGNTLANVPAMISLIRSYSKKEYVEAPIGSIVAIVSTFIYLATPVDLIPDAIPVIGHVDDIAVILACLKLVSSDIKDYEKWKASSRKN